jgi:hypothetical protein
MFKQFLLAAALVGTFQSCCHADPAARVAAQSSAVRPQVEATRVAKDLLDEIVSWLGSNFELPPAVDHPAIAFVSQSRLATMRAEDRAFSRGFTQDAGGDEPDPRSVVALYDNNLKTIFLPDDWTGKLPANQSIMVHEMVHHLQNIAGLKFECPMAREKVAYMAQDKWLKRFGTSLESEFDLDMFTVLISSACMY